MSMLKMEVRMNKTLFDSTSHFGIEVGDCIEEGVGKRLGVDSELLRVQTDHRDSPALAVTTVPHLLK